MKNKDKWSALEIEIEIMKFFGVRPNIIVPNVWWGMGLRHECDLLVLSKHNYATEIEIKVSKTDLFADLKKSHGHESHLIARFFYAVPPDLEEKALEVIPERAGLIVVSRNEWPKKVKNGIRTPMATKWSTEQKLKLAHLGTMRILGLKQTIQDCKSFSLKPVKKPREC